MEPIEINNELIQEREDAIETLCSDIGNLNDIFKDLSLLVSEQGESVNLIANNIESSMEKTVRARAEIDKASEYQKKSCKCCCVIL